MATETDAAKTFKMHTPLIGNRADCDRGGNERCCVNEGGGREGQGRALLLKAQASLEGESRSGVA